jgi:hypothetical protein
LLGAPSLCFAYPSLCFYQFPSSASGQWLLRRGIPPAPETRCPGSTPAAGKPQIPVPCSGVSVPLTPKREVLVLTRTGFSPLVCPCLWLKFQKLVCWLQPGSLSVHRSFQTPAEELLVGISLCGSPSFFVL